MKLTYRLVLLLLVIVGFNISYSQTTKKPKLVVGIVVDQMRFEYLYRFGPYFGDDGFKRLMNEGSNFTWAHYNYELTSTGPGHASIYTGSVPFYHGIIGNDFYNKQSGEMVNCVVDHSQKSVGSNDDIGECSPRRLMATTITDQLKLSSAGRSKVISVSLKNRGAVLPGGHFPDGVYWYNTNTGDFVTSSYYMNSLPDWVNQFNARKLPDSCLAEGWQLSLPDEVYHINPGDESEYEKDMFKEGKTSFPHTFENVKGSKGYSSLRYTTYGNLFVSEIAKAALLNEQLGKGNETDFLAISFSSTDYIGHEYGTYSYELQDAYIRLDRMLANLFDSFDRQVGKGNYILFLTTDHAGMETHSYLKENRLPVGELKSKNVFNSLTSFVVEKYGEPSVIENYSNRQVFLNREVLHDKKLELEKVERTIAAFIRDTFPEAASIMTRSDIDGQAAQRVPTSYLLNGFNPSRSGDVSFSLQPGYSNYFKHEGTGHGSSYAYDTHIPMLFYGWGIPAQTINTPVYQCDIAATISNLLSITEPNTCIGIPLINAR